MPHALFRRRRPVLVALLLLLIAAPGCSSFIVGTWKADPIPEDLEFYIISAEFKDNGDFQAVARTTDGKTQNMRGKYDFSGSTLTLSRPGAADRKYGAIYYVTGEMSISGDGGKQTLKKQ